MIWAKKAMEIGMSFYQWKLILSRRAGVIDFESYEDFDATVSEMGSDEIRRMSCCAHVCNTWDEFADKYPNMAQSGANRKKATNIVPFPTTVLSRGRNGHMKTLGVEIWYREGVCRYDKKTQEVTVTELLQINPLNTLNKGTGSDACMIQIPVASSVDVACQLMPAGVREILALAVADWIETPADMERRGRAVWILDVLLKHI